MSKFQVGDDLLIDSNHRLVFKNKLAITLPDSTYRLLLSLVENAPETVSHDKLIEAVWQDRVVSDDNLKKRVSRLRLALGDTSDAPKYLIAERGLGYRCIAPVKKLTEINRQTTSADYSGSEPAIGSDPAIGSGKEFLPPIPLSAASSIRSKSQLIGFSIFAIGLITITAITTNLLNQQLPVQPVIKQTSTNKVQLTADDYTYQAAQHYYRFNAVDNNQAIKLYKIAIDKGAQSGSTYAALASAYAQGYYQFGEKEDWLQMAIDYAMRAIEIEPRQSWGYNALGLAQYLSGRFDESARAYKKAIKISPNWGEPKAYSALVALTGGELFAAYQKAVQAVERDSTNPVTNAFLGLCYRELGMFESGRNILQQLLEKSPNYLLAHNYLAEIDLASGDHQTAQLRIDRILAMAPSNQLAHWTNAQLKLQTGDLKSAAVSFERAAQLGGRYQLPAKVHLAVITENPQQLISLEQKLSSEIYQGNQWAELLYSRALISLANDNSAEAIVEFESAVNAGMRQSYRLSNSPLLSTIINHPEFKKLINTLDTKRFQQRQKVIQLEHLAQEI